MKFIINNFTQIINGLTAILTGLILIFMLVPGDEPEATLQKILTFITQFSIK